MGVWRKITGFINTKFQLGFGGPIVAKDDTNSDQVNIRNSSDTADGRLKASELSTGSFNVLSNDGNKTVVTMADGATGDLSIALPNHDGNAFDVITTDGNGNWFFAVPEGASANKASKYNFDYDSTSPINLVNMANNTFIDRISVQVNTAFDGSGGRTLEIGLTSDVDKYIAVGEIDLTSKDKYVIDISELEAAASQMIATFTPAVSGATEGSARITVFSSVPAS